MSRFNVPDSAQSKLALIRAINLKMARRVIKGFRTYMVVSSSTVLEVYAVKEGWVRIQPDITPAPVVARNCFVAETYGRYRQFAGTFAVIWERSLKLLIVMIPRVD